MKKIINKTASEILKKKKEDKIALSDAIKNGDDIRKIAEERGIKLVQPL